MNLLLGFLCPLTYLVCIGILIAAGWNLFTKAGRPGWAVLVPVYNGIVYLDIIDKPAWHIVFLLIPFVSIYFAIVYSIEFVRRFGGGTGLALGVIFLPAVFIPFLAWGDFPYEGRPRRIKRRRRDDDYDDDEDDEDDDDRPRRRRRR